MDFFSGIVLGIIQGIAEFLPVSSSGHLVLARELLQTDAVHQLAVDGVLHLATVLAVIVYFWRDIVSLLQVATRKLSRLPVNEKDLTLLYALLIGTIPAAVLGLLLDDLISHYFYQTLTVAIGLLAGAIFFMYTEWRYYLRPPQNSLTVRIGFMIGLWQVLALIPGVSRSGITLAGGMLLGLTRHESAKFSFLLAIPVTLGVGVKKLFELIMRGEPVDWGPILVGAVISFLLALVVIHYFLSFIRRYSLWPFIWYTVILALLVGYFAIFIN